MNCKVHTLTWLCLFLSISLTAMPASTTIPFQLAGKLIIVQATVDGIRGNFILDTGVENLMLNAAYFRGSIAKYPFRTLTGTTEFIETKKNTVQIGQMTWDKVFCEILPLDHIEQTKGITIHGLIGTALLREMELLIDFQAGKMTLFTLDEYGEAAYFYLTQPADTLTFRWKGFLPSISGQVGDRRVVLGLDTGAEINLLDDDCEYQLKENLIGHNRETNLVGISPNKQSKSAYVLVDLKLDSWTCPPGRAILHSMRIHNESMPGPNLDGLIGYEMLSPYQTAINFKKKEIYVWQQEPFLREVVVARRNERLGSGR